MNTPILKHKSFFPDIESLRAIAVLMTMMAHFIPKESQIYVPFMWYGVDLFFTISGFLITYIFIKGVHSGHECNHGTVLKNFFIRRMLRLFPAYYLFVLFFFLAKYFFSLQIWKDEYNWYFFTYLQNIYYFKQGALNTSFSHLWSLGVEEQFYMIWPFILLYVPKRWYFWVFSVLIVLSLAINSAFQGTIDAVRVLTISNLHTLGIGALLAYFYYFKLNTNLFQRLVKVRFVSTIVSLTICIVVLNFPSDIRWLEAVLKEFFLMTTTGMVVMTSLFGWPKQLNFLFKNRVFHHFGKISYGLYLYHMLIPVVLHVLIEKIPGLAIMLPENILMQFIMLVVYSYLVALASFYLYENQFLKLKSRFSNQRKPMHA